MAQEEGQGQLPPSSTPASVPSLPIPLSVVSTPSSTSTSTSPPISGLSPEAVHQIAGAVAVILRAPSSGVTNPLVYGGAQTTEGDPPGPSETSSARASLVNHHENVWPIPAQGMVYSALVL